MKVLFYRNTSIIGGVTWSCKIDGKWVEGTPGNLHYPGPWKRKAFGQLSDFTDFIDYISDGDLDRKRKRV